MDRLFRIFFYVLRKLNGTENRLREIPRCTSAFKLSIGRRILRGLVPLVRNVSCNKYLAISDSPLRALHLGSSQEMVSRDYIRVSFAQTTSATSYSKLFLNRQTHSAKSISLRIIEKSFCMPRAARVEREASSGFRKISVITYRGYE